MSVGVPRAAALLCRGVVVHKRLRPARHVLRYQVFSLLVDVDRIDEATRHCRWLSHNRFNVLSLHDRDHGAGDATPLSDDARHAFAQAGHDTAGARVLLLTYPRLFGYAFNPLSVYFLIGQDDRLRALIYEVSNTFGERKRYVIGAGPAGPTTYAQAMPKELFVSPFTAAHGDYAFRTLLQAEQVVVAVALRDAAGPVIKTHFRGVPEPLTDAAARAAVLAYPLMTAKVVAGIHWEALKLWLKGVPLQKRHRSPQFSVSVAKPRSLILKDDHV